MFVEEINGNISRDICVVRVAKEIRGDLSGNGERDVVTGQTCGEKTM